MGLRDVLAVGIVTGGAWALSRYSKLQAENPTSPIVKKSNDPFIANIMGDMFALISASASGDGAGAKTAWTGLTKPAKTPLPRAAVITGEPSNIGEQLRSDLMRTLNLSHMHAGAIVTNLHWESGGFKSLQEVKPMVAGSRGGFGYAQWTGPRRRQFEAWVKARGLDARSYAANWGFLRHELTNTSEKAVLPRLRKTRTMRDAVITFCGSSPPAPSRSGFLRPGIPHLEKRVNLSRRYA